MIGLKLTKDDFQHIHNAVLANQSPKLGYKGFLLGVTGGDFDVRFQGKKIRVDLRECNIETCLLQEERRDLEVIPGKKARYQEVSYTIKPFTNIILLGTLTYSIETQQLKLIPSFLLRRIAGAASKTEHLRQAYFYIQNHLSSNSLKNNMLTALLIGIILLRKNYIMKIVRTITRLITWPFKKD